ncbi:hypothetical protein OESDEN_15920 [Oesophagostomum dentatum]|uniref:Uncharacterized protein n=1 Tax=Oesophagostomum dentatum TaxID=61180 RepID=A0A0B1SLF0_OESDE|nr:hypothetical protein OESDEN_15920 [Oesophagostomum dentatum]
MIPSHVVVFFPGPKNTDIVTASCVAGEIDVGTITKVRWQGRAYRAKIVFAGSKNACEAAIKNVTEEGDMNDTFFLAGDSATVLDANVDNNQRQDYAETKAAIQEVLTQLGLLSRNTTAMLREHRIAVEAKLIRLETRLCKIEGMLEEKNTTPSGEINFKYVSRERFESLLALKCGKMRKFALALEKDVFGDDSSELSLKIEDRKNSGEKINFMREVIFKYFNVSSDSEDSVWQTVKNALNGRARTVRRNMPAGCDDNRPALTPPPSEEQRLESLSPSASDRDPYNFFDDCDDY